jgi:lipoate-protein ligase A
MPTLDLLVQALVSPDASRAADVALLARAADTGRGTLRVWSMPGDVVLLGRFHRAPAGAADVAVHRRMTGGRAMACGDGFVGATLALPHRSALVGDDPFALAPEQVLNRCVRGLLGGLESARIPVVYPGRDLVTSNGRPIASLGLEVDERGATLVEAVLSVGRDQSLLPRLLDRVDVAGDVPSALLLPDDVASVQAALGRAPSVDEVADWLRRGFSARLGVTCTDAPSIRTESAPPVPPRDVRANDRHARTATMLGVLEAWVALADDGTIARIALCGDLLAPSWAIARLEAALVGCALDVERVAAVVDTAMTAPGAFLLGVQPLRVVADTIVQAARS